MRVLVTGGAGFIGSHLAHALVALGHDVVVLDNLRRGHRTVVPPAAEFVEGDIRDAATAREAARGCEVVFHLAAQSNVMGAMDDVEYSFTTNVAGTLNVLQAAAEAGARRVIFASSREAYGEPECVPVSENAPLTARNLYGASKVAAEAYCQAWRATAGLDTVVLRFANVYGPGDSGRVLPLWLARAVRGEDLELYGGAQVLDFVHVDIAVQALLAAMAPGVEGPINVGSGQGTALRDLAARIIGMTSRRSRLVVRPPRGPEVVRFVADVRRMRAVLGVEPPADSLAGLEAMVAELVHS